MSVSVSVPVCVGELKLPCCLSNVFLISCFCFQLKLEQYRKGEEGEGSVEHDPWAKDYICRF